MAIFALAGAAEAAIAAEDDHRVESPPARTYRSTGRRCESTR